MNELQEIIDGCKQSDRLAQQKLYEKYAPRFLAVCMRYLPRRDEAEDALTEAFLKIFEKIDTYNQQGSFEGWMRRVLVNECLMVLRKKKRLPYFESPDDAVIPVSAKGMSDLIHADLLNLLNYLPDGYRTVFSLYVLDGFKHREIAEILGISINTSKSQLILARKRMVELLEKINYEIS